MTDFIINVGKIEELQMLNDVMELEKIFTKAHRAIVQGMSVILIRKNVDGSTGKFDELTTEQDLRTYRNTVFKYLSPSK